VMSSTRPGRCGTGVRQQLERVEEGTEPDRVAITNPSSGVKPIVVSTDLPSATAASDARAELGVAVYLHRLRAGIAAMASAMGGLDALVFTGGVGENAPSIRSRAADGLGFLGVAVAPDRNSAAKLDAEIGSAGARVRVFAIRARKDIEIARGVRRAVG
jgi:acetate kinase